MKALSFSKPSASQGVTNQEYLIFNIWVLRRGLQYFPLDSRTFNSFYIGHKAKLYFYLHSGSVPQIIFWKSNLSDKIHNWSKIENKMMQIGFHPLEIKRNFVLWLLPLCELHSSKQSKSKNTSMHIVSRLLTSASAQTQNWLRVQTKCNMPMQLLLTVKRCAWKWVHCALFREWHNREV